MHMNKSIHLISFLIIIFFYAPSASTASDDGHANGTKGDSQIVFQGKLFCPLKRLVIMPFTGIFTDIRITPGQLVKKGEIVAQYDLDENSAIELSRQILFDHLDDLRRHREIEKQNIYNLEIKEQELLRMTAEKLSPQYLLDKLQTQLKLTRAYLSILEKRSIHARKLADRGLQHIRKRLGNSTLESGQIPDVVRLKAPISGMVLSLHPELRKSGLLPNGTFVAQIGKMDTMLIRSLVYERDAVRLKPGDTADFFPDSLPERRFSATVTSIDWRPANPDPNQPSYYQVEMTVDNAEYELREGFKGRIEYRVP